MLRRTDTVGTKYALPIWTGFLTVLSILMAGMILTLGTANFNIVASIVVVWTSIGLVVSMYALSRIKGKAAQIRADLIELRNIMKRYYGINS